MNASLIKNDSISHRNLNALEYLVPSIAMKYAIDLFKTRNPTDPMGRDPWEMDYIFRNRERTRKVIRKARIMRDNGELQG